MTNKVIIDGVDVRKCGFFHPEYDEYCHIALAFSEDYGECMECKDNPDCYYKQLQRLEAENEELKNKIFDEGLRRKTCKYYKQVCSENTQLIRLDEDLKVWQANAISHEQKEIEYKQALEKIEELCKMNCENCQYNPNWNNQDCECEFTDECEEIKIKDIINKINEVLK